LARRVVIDASVAIAALAIDDIHHAAAAAALASATDDEIAISATNRAEILIGPRRGMARHSTSPGTSSTPASQCQ
jgi:predicted nucleic acid-binding protein